MEWPQRSQTQTPPAEESSARSCSRKGGFASSSYSTHFEGNGPSLFTASCRQKLEGIVSKLPDAPYRSGKNETWLKAKCRPGMEFVIGGWAQKGAAFRSLLVGAYDHGKLIYVGKVGTGYGARVLDDLFPRLKKLEMRTSPFSGRQPSSSGDLHFVKPTLVAQVQFADWTADKLLRQASFKGLRADKPAARVTLAG